MQKKVIDFIKSDKRRHKNTRRKSMFGKNSTEIYKQLVIDYNKKEIINEIKNEYFRKLFVDYNLLDREELIEYVRFIFISEKIKIIGERNAQNSYDFIKGVLGIEENSKKLKLKDKELGKYIINQLNEYLRWEQYTFSFEEIIKDPDTKSISKEEVFRNSGIISIMDNDISTMNAKDKAIRDYIRYIKNIMDEGKYSEYLAKLMIKFTYNIDTNNINTYNIDTNNINTYNIDTKKIINYQKAYTSYLNAKLTPKIKENIKKANMEYLNRIKPDIALHNIWEAIILLKLRKLDKHSELNRTFKKIKSSKTSLNELNFSNEKKLMEYLYNEIDKNVKVLYNMEYYRLEKAMHYEVKKSILRTVELLSEEYENINIKKEIELLTNITKIKDIRLYDKMLDLYYKEYSKLRQYKDVFLFLIDLINFAIDTLLNNLKSWENNGWISDEWIMEELDVYPELYDLKEYRNNYSIRKEFSKKSYDCYKEIIRPKEVNEYNCIYKEMQENIEKEIFDNLSHIYILEKAKATTNL